MTNLFRKAALAGAVAGSMIAFPALAQDIEGDANSPLVQRGRMLSEPGSFWLDTNDEREVIRYTQPRDVRLCLPKPRGVGSADEGIPIRVTWDQTNVAMLTPGNCLFFDAKRVTLKPAESLPSGVTLSGMVETESALVK